MLKVWRVTGSVSYGWCLVVVSARDMSEAHKVAKGAQSSEYVDKWEPAERIHGVFDHADIPRILAQEIGCE